MKEPNFILPYFIKWLKQNDLYLPFRYNMAHDSSKAYNLAKWLEYLNGQKNDITIFNCHYCLMGQAPFEWTEANQPYKFGVHLYRRKTYWSETSEFWHRYLDELRNKGYYKEFE